MGAVAEALFGGVAEGADDLISSIEAALEDDFSRVPKGSDPLSRAVAELIEKMHRRASDTLSEVVKVSIGVNETAVMSAHLLHNLRRVDEETMAIATTAGQMANSVQEMASRGDAVVENARKAGHACNITKTALAATDERMRQINVAVEAAGAKISSIQELANSISGIATAIKKIAAQTNMLAINAAVEAARAGDAGKGFAVVAAEVKALSDRTASATVEIGDIIGKLHSGLSSMVASMKESRQTAEEGSQAMASLDDTLSSAARQIDDAVSNVGQIALSISQQKAAAAGVASAIGTVASSAAQSTRDLEQVISAMDGAQAALTAQLSALGSFNSSSAIIKFAQSDHVIWKKRLASMIIGREGLRENELASHRDCRLGKWYQKQKGTALGQDPEFLALDEPHCRVHSHGIEAVRRYNAGDMTGALRELACVEEASDDVLMLLRKLERRVERV